MINFSGTITSIIRPKLAGLAQESSQNYLKMKKETVFHSKTLFEMLGDTFQYKGGRPDTIYLKDAQTGGPVQAKVVVKSSPSKTYENAVEETYTIVDEFGIPIGEKTFSIKRHKNGSFSMMSGQMDNFSKQYLGVGIRLDQIQIERALQLGIKKIPRQSLAHATLYHTKMGFLPIEEDLLEIKHFKDLNKLVKQKFDVRTSEIKFTDIVPIIVQKGLRFFIDVNKTQAMTNLAECKRRIDRTGAYRLWSLDSYFSYLELSGKELKKWKQMLKGRTILDKLTCRLPEY